jgi:subtilisin family serine protease
MARKRSAKRPESAAPKRTAAARSTTTASGQPLLPGLAAQLRSAVLGQASVTTAETAAKARRIVYVHGIGNKPIASILKCQWDTALYGFDLGDRSRMAYWVNRERYPKPDAATCANGDLTEGEADASDSTFKALGLSDDQWLEQEIEALSSSAAEQKLLHSLADAMTRNAEAPVGQVGAKASGLPPFLRKLITRRITRTFLKDVHDLFYDAPRREAMITSVLERIEPGGGPFVVIGHSQGSMVAYLALLRMAQSSGMQVPLFVTIGSPLGITEVQDQLKRILKAKKLPVPTLVGRWLNVADRWDPVALDNRLEGDFQPGTRGILLHDEKVKNTDGLRHAHSATGYLRTDVVRMAVRKEVDAAQFQPISDFVIAGDVVRDIENAASADRHEVLIELAGRERTSISAARQMVRDAIARMIAEQKTSQDDYEIEELERFTSVKLTRREAEVLASTLGGKAGDGIWRTWKNARRVALLETSINTLQVRPAHNAYRAFGRGLEWAVLDSGINPEHPHFTGDKGRKTVVAQYDCTRRQALKEGAAPDAHGHGTHVAGIIAGRLEREGRVICGIAPDTLLHIYKVLDDAGNGKDSWIIKALDHIASVNEGAGALKIHGVNLSLGGPFDPSAYACGHSPLCRELRRLWRQGVVVVIAAGNEGYVTLQSEHGDLQANLPLTIGDPANLEESIVVGSVHKSKPHTYGGSYFSSRGPTADGRQKPDVVAPGERILSCRHEFDANASSVDDLYVEMSGTSMAAPHVAGLVAAFLSIHPEFIGYPDKVKAKLLAACTDLGRERAQQGAGMPNLLRMLGAS